MSKFFKRIQKTLKKDLHNSIVIGYNEKNFEFIVEDLQTVFYIDHKIPSPKNRKIIPIDTLSFLNELTTIDIIFINQGFDENILQFIPSLTRRCSPYILLSTETNIGSDYYDLFKRIYYEMIIIIEDYQVWKPIKK